MAAVLACGPGRRPQSRERRGVMGPCCVQNEAAFDVWCPVILGAGAGEWGFDSSLRLACAEVKGGWF